MTTIEQTKAVKRKMKSRPHSTSTAGEIGSASDIVLKEYLRRRALWLEESGIYCYNEIEVAERFVEASEAKGRPAPETLYKLLGTHQQSIRDEANGLLSPEGIWYWHGCWKHNEVIFALNYPGMYDMEMRGWIVVERSKFRYCPTWNKPLTPKQRTAIQAWCAKRGKPLPDFL